MYLEVILVKYLQSQVRNTLNHNKIRVYLQDIVKPTIVTALLGNIANVIGLVLLLYVAGLEIE